MLAEAGERFARHTVIPLPIAGLISDEVGHWHSSADGEDYWAARRRVEEADAAFARVRKATAAERRTIHRARKILAETLPDGDPSTVESAAQEQGETGSSGGEV